jgi:hypothetical protein
MPGCPCLAGDTHFERHLDLEYDAMLASERPSSHGHPVCMPRSAQQHLPPHATMPQTHIALQKRGISPPQVLS